MTIAAWAARWGDTGPVRAGILAYGREMVVISPALTSAPSIETERLSLRGHALADFRDVAALWGDPGVTRYIGGRAFNDEEAWARLLRYAGHWTLLGFGTWVVRERRTERFVGETGFADYRRQIVPALDAPEVGWVLAPWAHGQGFATEAVRAVLAWGEAHFASGRMVCIIHPENAASIRVAEKCGFTARVHTTYQGRPTILFDRERAADGAREAG